MELKLGSIDTIIISSPKMAKMVLNIHDLAFVVYSKLLYS
jgi:hypothetical protein